MSKIKICGLKRIEDIKYANELKPDYVGFVFAGSKRKLTFDQARELKKYLNPDIPVVGVFVNEKIDFISKLISDKIVDCVQLHGDEDETYIKKLRNVFDGDIIKAARVRSREDIEAIQNIGANYLLLDAYSPNEYGGSGESFDSSLIPEDLEGYFLAGGLNESNIKDLILKHHPYAIDVSSGVETDGFKDKDKMKKVIDIVRSTR